MDDPTHTYLMDQGYPLVANPGSWTCHLSGRLHTFTIASWELADIIMAATWKYYLLNIDPYYILTIYNLIDHYTKLTIFV